MTSLANFYRPTEFSQVCGQDVNIKVLNKQVNTNTYNHPFLFVGNAGCGKTTCARILANKINGEIIELDCASHNGVADIKEIIDRASVKPLLHDYKVIILDECHTLSSQAWSSLLITLEENIPTAIFIFCTTDPQKIPSTILSRVQRFNFLPITNEDMLERLKYICKEESISITDIALTYIIKSAKGNLRQALTNLDKCLLYEDLSAESICKVLNIVSDNILDDVYTAFENKDIKLITKLIQDTYNNGYELHQFTRQLLDYCIEKKTNLELVERLLTILQDIRYDDNPKNIIIARLII